jgi:hypothetical protein
LSAKTITPVLGEKSFSCPHCGALAHQSWSRIYGVDYENGASPRRPDPSIIDDVNNDPTLPDNRKRDIVHYFQRLFARRVFLETHESGEYLRSEIVNLHLSHCYSCGSYAVWLADALIYPKTQTEIEPNPDMPEPVRADFLEAADVVDASPRAAAALLRLCVQNLMLHLGLKGSRIDLDIAELLRRGLDARLRKALEAVRVVGERAVAPGRVDPQDDRNVAMKLFRVVNLIVDATITTPKHIDLICAAAKNAPPAAPATASAATPETAPTPAPELAPNATSEGAPSA